MESSSANHLAAGIKAEQFALAYLESQGLRLLEKNYRSPYGEIDLILGDKDVLVFVEVRYRSSDEYGGGAASVTQAKRARIMRTANHFLTTRALDDSICRFDVISASNSGSPEMQINWIKDAFEE